MCAGAGAAFGMACAGGGHASPTRTPASGPLTITVHGRAFSPDQLALAAGATATITLQNGSAEAHTLTVYLGANPEGTVVGDTGEVAPGETGQVTLLFTSGKHAFRCTIHPQQMQGVIDVR